MLRRALPPSRGVTTATTTASSSFVLSLLPQQVDSAKRVSYLTQLFDGRIFYADLFPYPTADRTQTEAGAAAVQKLLTSSNNPIDIRALIGAQMPPHAPVDYDADNSSGSSEQNKHQSPHHASKHKVDFGINASNASQDTVAWLAQSTMSRLDRPHDVTSALASHLSVGSHVLRLLSGEFSPEVQSVAGGSMHTVVAADESISGSYIAAGTTRAKYDDDKMMYMLEGEKVVSSWPSSSSSPHQKNASASATQQQHVPEKKLLLVLARADTQTTNDKGETQLAQRLAWFPVDLSSPQVRATVIITADHHSGGGGATLKFNGTPVPGGDVLGAIGEGFRHHGIATLTTHHLLSSCIVGVGTRALAELAAIPSGAALGLPPPALSVLRSRIYALESTTFAFATNLDRQMSDTIIESACLSVASFRLARDLRMAILDVLPMVELNSGMSSSTATRNNSNRVEVLKSAAGSLLDLMSALGHPDHMSLLAGCCGVEDYGLKLNRRPTLEMSTLRMSRSLGNIDKFPSLVTCKPQAKTLEKQIVKFAGGVHSAFVHNGPAVFYRESLLSDIGLCAAVLYQSSCALARANRASASKQPTAESETKLAALYMGRAASEADSLLQRIESEATAPSRLTERMSRFCVNCYSSAPFMKAEGGGDG